MRSGKSTPKRGFPKNIQVRLRETSVQKARQPIRKATRDWACVAGGLWFLWVSFALVSGCLYGQGWKLGKRNTPSTRKQEPIPKIVLELSRAEASRTLAGQELPADLVSHPPDRFWKPARYSGPRSDRNRNCILAPDCFSLKVVCLHRAWRGVGPHQSNQSLGQRWSRTRLSSTTGTDARLPVARATPGLLFWGVGREEEGRGKFPIVPLRSEFLIWLGADGPVVPERLNGRQSDDQGCKSVWQGWQGLHPSEGVPIVPVRLKKLHQAGEAGLKKRLKWRICKGNNRNLLQMPSVL